MSEMNDFNARIIEEFRANGGVLGGGFAGMPVVILTTTGAKTGAKRENPVAYRSADDTIYVFASAAGAPRDPDWFRNLVANPAVHVELGTESFDAEAIVVDRPKRDELYAAMAADFDSFREYETLTERVIPVVELRRR
jgi:deazaflavin-dependent oxidoreductase (nitroreductase family)